MSKYDEFAAEFGKEQADRIVDAAYEHANGINSENKGDDHFKWALLICIGYDCISKPNFRSHHKITVPYETLKNWIKGKGELAIHNGDLDYLALFCGRYDEFVADPVKPGE